MNRPYGLPGFRSAFNDIVAAVVRIGRFVDLAKVVDPGAPDADKGRLFVADDGASGTTLFFRNQAGSVYALRPATAAEMEAASADNVITSPARQHRHPGHPKFWGYATGDGVSLLASHNVASIVDTGTGRLTVTIATDFASANWAHFVSCDMATTSEVSNGASTGTKAAGSVEFFQWDVTGNALVDPAAWNFGGLGDQA